jgi:hypothetical protein
VKIRQREASSFRDPAGFLFTEDGVLYRQVNPSGLPDYRLLMDSGLYQQLVEEGLLIAHEELPGSKADPAEAIILQPTIIPFVTYPFEWCFSQLKHAALTTLAIEIRALEKGMTLKDCSAFNIQFLKGKPILIDTLSFERYPEGKPWDAYRQFCQHFLAPLALMAYVDIRLNLLLRDYIDGIPLDLASRLLPRRTHLILGLTLHIHHHARLQKRFAEKDPKPDQFQGKISRAQLTGLINNLESTIEKLNCMPTAGSGWTDYETFHNYSPESLEHKKEIVNNYLEIIHPQNVWDFGANTGTFSRLASQREIFTVAFDLDSGAVERNYLNMLSEGDANLLPLVMDLTNPSPGLGWRGEERKSLVDRGPAHTIMALALLHHLAIGNNVPLSNLADFFQRLSRWSIIEFIPRQDPQVSRLLQVRRDIFSGYNQETFENTFCQFFNLVAKEDIQGTDRTIYLFRNIKILP